MGNWSGNGPGRPRRGASRLGPGLCFVLQHGRLSRGRGIAALRNGILILMIPPVIIFGLVSYFTVRWGNRFNDEIEVEERSLEGGDLHDVRI